MVHSSMRQHLLTRDMCLYIYSLEYVPIKEDHFPLEIFTH